MSDFRVDDKVFHCALADAGEFVVRSMPRSYRVSWDDGVLLFKKIKDLVTQSPRNLLLIDENILELYSEQIDVPADRILALPATEKFKSLEGVSLILEFLHRHQFTKSDTLVVVGGGIVQELGAFASACFKRGISWIFFPTTLLAMCDSCIGGKASLNYGHAKNQLGLFYPPREVVINPQFLQTLSPEAIRSGLGEILKMFIMGGQDFLSLYQRYVKHGQVINWECYHKLILGALNIKRVVIEEDEFEFNHRKSLNYGHTLGHAIEILSDYAIPHGLAIVCGMILENELSVNQGLLSQQVCKELNSLARELLTDDTINRVRNMQLDSLLSLLQKDKKVEKDSVSFVMLREIGDVCFKQFILNQELIEQIKALPCI